MTEKNNKILDGVAKTNKDAAEWSATKGLLLGKHVAAIITEHGDVSVALLRESIEKAIASSKSVTGDKNPQFDLPRLENEALLLHLDTILASRCEN